MGALIGFIIIFVIVVIAYSALVAASKADDDMGYL